MSWPAATGSGVSIFVTPTFACAVGEATVVVIVSVLSVASLSLPALWVVTVLVRTVPLATVEGTVATSGEVDGGRVGQASPPSSARCRPFRREASRRSSPAGGVTDENVVPGGSTSVIDGLVAAFGPWLSSWNV